MAIAKTETMTEQEYRRFALSDPLGRWELHNGQLRQRPGMNVEHGDVMDHLAAMLHAQLDRDEYRVRTQHARLRLSPRNYYIPDVVVIPTAMVRALLKNPGSLDAYPDSLPLVVEIWSPSTGDYDLDEKVGEYQL